MTFTRTQIDELSAKLRIQHVKERVKRGFSLSYIEGWHAISEANRIFGFDGWDRETIHSECVWKSSDRANPSCAYVARVRIRVRTDGAIVTREGTGYGQSGGLNLGEAHENVIKEAETDATKRALMTFGNQFGLALYDPEKRGVTRSRKKSVGAVPETWPLFDENGAAQMEFSSAGEFCGALKKALKNAQSTGWLNAIWSHNQTTIEKVRANCPELVGSDQTHFSEFLQRIYDRCAQELATPAQASEKPVGPLPSPATNPRRIRDNEHLRRVALLPCIVCDRQPSQAHHIRFAQPRALGRKSSDEFVVPLCNLHHRSLHDAGNEENWWKDFRIDPLHEAQALWERHKNT